MVYEVTRDWPTPRPVQTPLERTTGPFCAAGDAGADPARGWDGRGVLRLFPRPAWDIWASIAMKKRWSRFTYYKKLPPDIASTEVLLIDPMLATGGSASAAVQVLKQSGVTEHEIRLSRRRTEGIVGVSPPVSGDSDLLCRHRPELNEKGYILPGLGDAGTGCLVRECVREAKFEIRNSNDESNSNAKPETRRRRSVILVSNFVIRI